MTRIAPVFIFSTSSGEDKNRCNSGKDIDALSLTKFVAVSVSKLRFLTLRGDGFVRELLSRDASMMEDIRRTVSAIRSARSFDILL